MAITEAERLAQALEHFCTNWDGSARHDRKTPLNGLLCCDLRQAAAELRRLSADAQRLDWIERNPGFSSCVVVDAPHDGEYMVRNEWAGPGYRPATVTYGPTLRAAIDQARKNTP